MGGREDLRRENLAQTHGERDKGRTTFSRGKKGVWKRWAFVGVLLYFLVSGLRQEVRLWVLRGQAENYRKQVESLRQESTELQQKIQLLMSDAYVEKMARERLGLIKPGETPYYPK